MKRITDVLPRERYPHEPLLIPLRLDARLGIGGHKSSQTSAFLHPSSIKLPFQAIDLSSDHAVLIPRRPITA